MYSGYKDVQKTGRYSCNIIALASLQFTFDDTCYENLSSATIKRGVCVFVFIKLQINAQSGPAILVIVCATCIIGSPKGGLMMYVCIVIVYSRVWISRVRLPILLVVS